MNRRIAKKMDKKNPVYRMTFGECCLTAKHAQKNNPCLWVVEVKRYNKKKPKRVVISTPDMGKFIKKIMKRRTSVVRRNMKECLENWDSPWISTDQGVFQIRMRERLVPDSNIKTGYSCRSTAALVRKTSEGEEVVVHEGYSSGLYLYSSCWR
jgi:hypothetical protein